MLLEMYTAIQNLSNEHKMLFFEQKLNCEYTEENDTNGRYSQYALPYQHILSTICDVSLCMSQMVISVTAVG